LNLIDDDDFICQVNKNIQNNHENTRSGDRDSTDNILLDETKY
jgi:hypothetical protein